MMTEDGKMSNEKKIVEVEVKSGLAYSGPAICFIFSVFCFLFWANILGILGDGGNLAVGAVQLGAFVSYLAGSIILYQRGADFEANVFMIFTAFFAGVGGLLNVFSSIAEFVGMPFSGKVGGICWLLCGIFLLSVLPANRKAPKAGFGVFSLAGIALTLMGLWNLEILSNNVAPIVAWLLFVVGVLGFLMMLSPMCSFGGLSLSLGKPFFTDQVTENVEEPDLKSLG